MVGWFEDIFQSYGHRVDACCFMKAKTPQASTSFVGDVYRSSTRQNVCVIKTDVLLVGDVYIRQMTMTGGEVV